MVWGDYQLLLDTADEVYSYLRIYEDKRWLVVANFSNTPHSFTFPEGNLGKVIISNLTSDIPREQTVNLAPWDAFVVELGD